MADIPIPPIPPRRAPLIDIMRELEARPRARQSQEFDPVAALAAERRSQSRQPLPLPPIPPAVAPPRTAGDSAEAGPPLDLSAVAPTIRSRLPEDNPYVAAAIDIAEKYNLPRDVFLSLVHQESKFDPKAKSPRGAFGLTQLMPGTARELGVDPRDPMANLDAGARYLRQQIDRFGSLPLALAAYNAGPQRVIDAGRVVPNIRETQDYVHKIMRNAGMEGYGYAEGGLAALDEKYAEGGRVRRPAAAPVASPFDADYIERLAAQAIGSGEPVTELRSAEGRGFAPMPRSFGEAGQRMSAVVRGDVEPTPEEERQISHVRGFTEGPAAIKAFHASPHRFERFNPEKFGSETDPGALGRAAYFSTDPKVGGADRIHRYEADLDINNPLNLPFPSWFTRKVDIVSNALGLNAPQNLEDWKDWAKTVTQIARERGHDAIVLDYSPVKYNQKEIAVFDPEKINILRRYAEGGLAALDEKYANGGTVRAPKETTIAGQDHRLAYITPEEAALLKARGGSGRMTDYGVRAYDEGPGGEGPGGQGPGGDPSDNAGSMSDPSTQDAAGGNAGQGAGPTGAGAGPTGEQGPGPTGEDTGGETQAGPLSFEAPLGVFDSHRGMGIVGGLASLGLGVPGLGTVAAGIGAAIDAQRAQEQLDQMGITANINTPQAMAHAASLGMFGQSVANQFGNAIGFDAFAEAPMSATMGTPNVSAPTADTSGGEYLQYGQTQYGTPGLSNIATSMAPATAASLVDWNQIQREASAMNMSVSDYLALKWRSPATMARGGMASLEQMHAKYAEGGPVVSVYDPDEINDLANQILEGAYV